MFPRPSRLKSLASELSPVLTTPPPVEPKTVLVLISVPEMMLSSNLVAVRRRAANRPAMSASMPSTAAAIAQVGVLPKTSSKNESSALDPFGVGAATLVVVAFVSGAFVGVVSGAFVSGALVSATAGSAALLSGAATTGGDTGAGGGTTAGAGGTSAAGAGDVVAGATVTGGAAGGGGVGAAATFGGALFASAAAFALPASACLCRSAIVWLLSSTAFCMSLSVFSRSAM